MKSLNDLLNMGLSVVLAEVRGSRCDTYKVTDKKSGQVSEIFLVRVDLEVGGSATSFSADGQVGGGWGDAPVKVVPEWAVKGKQYYFGCASAERKMNRTNFKIIECCPVVVK